MKIFISQSKAIIKSYKDKVDYLSDDWQVYFNKIRSDIILIPIPNNKKLVQKMIKELKPNGLILTGGNDLGEFKNRDETEFKMIREFLKLKKPVLGVCRGMQVLNSFYGGKLSYKNKSLIDINHTNSEHKVNICDDYFFKKKKIKVNSFHKFLIKKKQVAKNFTPFAISDDGVVEGFYDLKKNIFGIQWHLERPSPSKKFDLMIIEKIFKI